MVGIDIAVVGIEATRDRDTTIFTGARGNHGRIAGAIVRNAHQRFDDRTRLDLVIVLADDPFFARDVRPPHQTDEHVREVLLGLQHHVSFLWCLEHRRTLQTRHAVVQEMHFDIGDLFAVDEQFELTRVGDFTQVDRFDAFGGEDGQTALHVLGRNAGDHALLRFTDPDLGVAQSRILQWHAVEMNTAAVFRRHFAAGRRQTASTTVRQRGKASGVARLQRGIENFFLFDGVADLHRAATDGL